MATKSKKSIEQQLELLDETVEKLSDNDTTLDDALLLYADAAKTIAELSAQLSKAQVQIEEITKSLTAEVEHAENEI